MTRTRLVTMVVLGVSAAAGCSNWNSSSSPEPLPCVADTRGGSRQPPSAPTASSAPDGGTRRWFAMNLLLLGTIDRRTGAASPTAWQDYGYDLDHRATTACDSIDSKGTCRRDPTTPASILADGNEGIDNAFSAHLVQTLRSLRNTVEDQASDPMRVGERTLVLRLDDVRDGDDPHAPGALWIGRDLGTLATFTEADHWGIAKSSLADGVDLENPLVTFPGGYVRDGIWVSGPPSTRSIDVAFPFASVLIVVPVDGAVLSFRLADGADGILAGATSVKNIDQAFRPLAVALGVCPGNTTFEQVMDTLTMSADVVSGAPELQDPTRPCDALSVGFGFTMKPTGAPARIVEDPPPPSDDCDAGVDGATDGRASAP